MGLPELRPEEIASHDLELFYYVASRAVAIDVAKLTHHVLLELPSGKRRAIPVTNTRTELDCFIATLRALERPREITFEPTTTTHRDGRTTRQ